MKMRGGGEGKEKKKKKLMGREHHQKVGNLIE
jgi:hypothetical protein